MLLMHRMLWAICSCRRSPCAPITKHDQAQSPKGRERQPFGGIGESKSESYPPSRYQTGAERKNRLGEGGGCR